MGPDIDPVTHRVGGTVLDRGETQSWFALYNALGLSYNIAGNLTGFINVANRYSRFTWETQQANPLTGVRDKPASTLFLHNDLMGVLGLTYRMSTNIILQGALSIRYIISDSKTFTGAYHELPQTLTQDVNKGTLTFAVPLWMRVTF